MLARILPILALLVLCVLGYWLWSQGTINQIIRPTVVAVETKRQLIEGQKVRKSFIVVKEIAITRIEPGMITFPTGTTEDVVEKSLSGQSVARNIDKGKFLRSTMMGKSSGFIVLRATDDIQDGDSLTLENIQASQLDVAPPGGAIIFDSEEEAALYISRAYDLAARKTIFSGQVLTIDDTAGGNDKIFVIRTSREFSRSERLSIGGLEAAEISGKDMPSGVIAFQTRGAADVFITSSGKYVLSESVDQGETITANMISSETSDQVSDPSDLPRTLSELTSYMKAYPDRAMFIESTTFIGSRVVRPDEKVDIWVEDSRSGGAFGQINLVRLDEGVTVRLAEDSSDPNRKEGSTGSEPVSDDPAVIGESFDEGAGSATSGSREYLWVVMDPDVKARFDAAKSGDRVAFTVRDGEPMVDLLGNGASCRDDICQINRQTSNDMEEIVASLAPTGSRGDVGGDLVEDPLAVMDGVGLDLADRLRNNGYDSFDKIAAWTDSDILAVTIKLDISNNLAVYIRQQARILSTSADTAANDLGFDEVPQN
jgi:predicted flap endonuclease-1-like 5' DNA nuclease/flagella basal body P-ring formation protein FlgA